MLILLVLAASLVIALARRGNVGNLSNLRPRFLWLFFVPLGLQLIAFSPIGESQDYGEALVKVTYIASMAIAALALALNRHLPGLVWVAAGLTLNLIVILANGWLMPVSGAARQFAGMPALDGPTMNVIPMTSDTRLPWLGDILPLPAWVPLANVFSLGDILVTIGGAIFVQKALVPPSPGKSESRV